MTVFGARELMSLMMSVYIASAASSSSGEVQSFVLACIITVAYSFTGSVFSLFLMSLIFLPRMHSTEVFSKPLGFISRIIESPMSRVLSVSVVGACLIDGLDVVVDAGAGTVFLAFSCCLRSLI